MASYSTRLINRALEALDQTPVDFVDGNDLSSMPTRVRKLIGQYDHALRLTLKAIGRGEFIGRAVLSPLDAKGDFLFPYRFLLPEDALDFTDPDRTAELERSIELVGAVEQIVLKAKSDSALELTYVRRVNPDFLGAEAFEACGLNLAALVAWNMTGSRDHADRIENKAQRAIQIARGSVPRSSEDRPQRAGRMGYVRGGARR